MLKFHSGSGAASNVPAGTLITYLVADTNGGNMEWYHGDTASYNALDWYGGDCQIVQSCLTADYVAFCESLDLE